MTTIYADVETDGLLLDMTTIWCLAIADEHGQLDGYADQPGYKPLREGIARLRAADRIIGHNFMGFDLWAINKVYPGTVRMEQITDTLILSRLENPEREAGHSLASWGERMGFAKGHHEDWTKFSPEMFDYCLQDVRVTAKTFRALDALMRQSGVNWEQSIDLEHKVAFILGLQYLHGFRLDVNACFELETKLRIESEALTDGMQSVFPPIMVPLKGDWNWDTRTWDNVLFVEPKVSNKTRGTEKGVPYTKIELETFNPGSREQIARRLSMTSSWKPTKCTANGTPMIDEKVLDEIGTTEAKTLNRSFRLTKMLGQIADGKNGWLKLVTPAGRIHGSVNGIGCRTNRMSHFAPNMAQVDKEMRTVWLPDEGHVLVGVDGAGLELRMLAHYLFPWDLAAYGKMVVHGKKEDGTEIHSVNQRLAGLAKRDDAKTLIYAMFYGGGDIKLGSIVKPDGTDNQKRLAGAKLRRKIMSGTPGFEKLVDGCKMRHDTRGFLIGLDGRRLMSNSQHSALNTLLQGAGAIVMKMALVLFHFELAPKEGLVDETTWLPRGFGYCANVHDEVQFSVAPKLAPTVGALFADAIRLAGERLNMKCPLAGTLETGSNWHDTH